MPLIKRRLKRKRLKRWVKKSKISLIIDNEIERLKKRKDVDRVEIEAKFKIHFKGGKTPKTRYAKEIVEYD